MNKSVFALAVALAASGAMAQSFVYERSTNITNTKETRYMGGPLLSPQMGRTVFTPNPTVRAVFMQTHPCPSNPAATNEAQCFGWEPVYVIAIACGGGDSVMNLMWLPSDMAARKRAYETKTDARAPYAVPFTVCVTTPVS